MDDKRLDELLQGAAKDTSIAESAKAAQPLEALFEEITMEEQTESTVTNISSREGETTQGRSRWLFSAAAALILVAGIGALLVFNGQGSEEARNNVTESPEVENSGEDQTDATSDKGTNTTTGDKTENKKADGNETEQSPSTVVQLTGQSWLESPSGNVLCNTSNNRIDCNVDSFTWDDSDLSAACKDDYIPGDVSLTSEINDFTVVVGSCVTDCSTPRCIWTTENDLPADKFDYGEELLLGNPDDNEAILCTSTQQGITCSNGKGGILVANRSDDPRLLQDFWTKFVEAGRSGDEAALRSLGSGLDETQFSMLDDLAKEALKPTVHNDDEVSVVNRIEKGENGYTFSSFATDSSGGFTTEHSMNMEFKLIDGEYRITNSQLFG